MTLLTPLDVTRRIVALLGFLALVLLALTLLWRVYLHHNQTDPYDREGGVTVSLDVSLDVRDAAHVKISDHLR